MRQLWTMAIAAAALAGCAASGEVRRMELSSTLTGFQAVPGPGDRDGTGTMVLRADAETGRLCWTLTARGIARATAAHIHRGEAGSAGPPGAPLTPPDATGRSEGCATAAPELVREMMIRPHGFYVNVHNQEHPAGAIRGQLRGQLRRPERQPLPPGRR